MAALNLPLSVANLADLIRVESVAWNILRMDEMSMIGGGEFLTHDLGPQLWEADVSSVQMYHAEAQRVLARFNALDGSNHAFYLYNPTEAYPATDLDGALFGAATTTILSINADRKQLAFTGAPLSLLIPWGTWFHVEAGSPSRRWLHVTVADITANGSGVTGQVEVRPHLRPGVTTTLGVTFVKPAAKVKVVPDSLRIETTNALMSRITFQARQTLQAG